MLVWALGCRSAPEEGSGGVEQRGAGQPVVESAPASARAEPVAYRRSLVGQLDLVSGDADGYLVVRDLQPLLEQARRVEQVLAGPLRRAVPVLAALVEGGGEGAEPGAAQAELEARLARVRERLGLALAAVERSGIDLGQGLVVSQGEAGPVLAFAAADLGPLAALGSLISEDGAALVADSCAALDEPAGWFACSLAGPEGLARYRPARQGERLAAALTRELPGVELARVNVAVAAGSTGGVSAVLRTDPGLWELSVPVPELAAGSSALVAGPAPALAHWQPGAPFMWARLEGTMLAELLGAAGVALGGRELLTGEVYVGVLEEPAALVAQLGTVDPRAAQAQVGELARALPAGETELEALQGLELAFDRASVELDGKPLPAIGLTLSGEEAQAWRRALAVDTRARLWADGGYFNLALGEVQAVPAALRAAAGSGLSTEDAAALPVTLARSLLAGEVGLVIHVVLDDLQAPLSDEELVALMTQLPAGAPMEVDGLRAIFAALAPWSTVDLWTRRVDGRWLAQLSLVPFVGGPPGPEASGAELSGAEPSGAKVAERDAAEAVLAAVLAGEASRPAYRGLLRGFPSSPRRAAYRARAGEAPGHFATAGLLQLSALAAVVGPALRRYLDRVDRAGQATESTPGQAPGQAAGDPTDGPPEREAQPARAGPAGREPR